MGHSPPSAPNHTPPPFAPGEEHHVFQKDVGVWDAEIEVRPTPGAPPQRSQGESRNALTCGGRWLTAEFHNSSGFEGRGLYGWDSTRRCYVGTWVDSMRGFLAVAEGSWDAATRTMTFWTEVQRPDGSQVRWREETRTLDADTQVFRSFMPGPDGTEFELMTVTYRRRHEAPQGAARPPARP